MKWKWINNYEKEMQKIYKKTHYNSDTSHELKRDLKL